MLTYLLGPVLSLLPQRWRKSLFEDLDVDWVRATLLSGMICGFACLLALAVWYMYAIEQGIEEQVDVTLVATKGAPGRGAGMAIGFASLLAFALHPLTWTLTYYSVEGVYRAFAAAVNAEAPGTGPLALLDWTARALGRQIHGRRVPLVRDRVTADAEGNEWNLKVESCRPKPTWKYPLTVKYGEEYFCVLGDSTAGSEARPHVYLLKRVPAGEAYRGMEIYDPGDVLQPGAPTLAQATFRALRDGFRVKTLPLVADTVERSVEEAGVFLVVSSCRPKEEWGEGRLIRFEECFYRVEETFEADPPRPFCFRLRLLPAGVPGRRIIDYRTDDVLKQAKA